MPKTIKELAELQGISDTQLRNDIEKYKNELEGHINRDRKPMILDDYAVDFLNQKREAIMVINQSNSEQLKHLQEENDKLKAMIMQLQQETIEHMKQINSLQLETTTLHHQIEMKQIEVESKYHKSLFGFYRKVK